jgi:hypothetical protein
VEAVLDRVPEQQVNALLAKLQAPPLNEIADMPTLVQVVQGLRASSTVPTPAQPDTGCPLTHTGDTRAFVCLPCPSLSRDFENEHKCIDRTELQPVRN